MCLYYHNEGGLSIVSREEIFLGLDIGTESVGWAVCSDDYKLKKFKNNLMWGVNLFDEASQATDRRTFRTSRRRLDRKKRRISLLQELFAPEILKTDAKFFMRLKESALFPEDSTSRRSNIYFDDDDYDDEQYNKDFPTIHHLIVELMNNTEPHDIRLVYLACSYILSHRGHFLSEVDKNKVSEILDFSEIYNHFIILLNDICEHVPFDAKSDEVGDILKSGLSITKKEKLMIDLLFGGKKPKDEFRIKMALVIKLICGGKVKLSELFKKDYYTELDKDSITVSSADFPDTLEELRTKLDDGDADFIESIKNMYDWSVLINTLNGSDYISEAKIKVYDKHRDDLKKLKNICRKYLEIKKCNEIFKTASDKANYVSYSYNVSSIKKHELSDKFKKTNNQEDFCKFILGYLKDLCVDPEDKEEYDYLVYECKNGSLCPKQVTSDNRVIPYQLYYVELKKILKNASAYLPFLNETDQYNKVSDKILQLMEFRIPYYVGPLVSSEKSKNAWLVRNPGKEKEKIYPWNFDEIVDHDETEKQFIRRMTCKCTYLAGEDVLPKNSLLYCKFNVLNEINKIAVDGQAISPELKQDLYNELFVEKKCIVTKKRILNYFKSRGLAGPESEISGIDDTVKSSLKSYHDFKKMIESGKLSETDVEAIIERITVTTDKKRLKNWISEKYKFLSSDDIKSITRLNYKDYGRLSRALLEDITEVDSETGEIVSDENIITRLWTTNDNIMQILGSKYKYSDVIRKRNDLFYTDNELTVEKQLEEMYISPAVKRSVMRTLDIVKELKKILGRSPDKIFIEMSRGELDNSKKGKRTQKRREFIEEKYKVAREFVDEKEIKSLESKLSSLSDSDLRSEKLFLYFTQLGRCMYSGKSIDFDKIGNDTIYNIDHIYPQAKVKDDSLENKVLVLSKLNGEKSDSYPIADPIRKNMHSFWSSLFKIGLISEKKYSRLTRSTGFTDDELTGFISRQLVETRQSTKAVSQILNNIYPESEIIYVKAGIVSDFRHEMDMLKCREVNDLHHAKDAYLNIVLGNVYNTKFTQNPANFIKTEKNYSLKLFKKDSNGKESGLLTHKVERYGKCAWDPTVSFDVVRNTMSKNSIRYVKYSYRRKGGFFNQNPERAKDGLIEMKSGLDTAKYGGYNNSAASHFSIVKYNNSITIIPVEVMFESKYNSDELFAKEYAVKQIKEITGEEVNIDSVIFPYGKRIVKINTLLEIDGFKANIVQKSNKGKTLVVSSALSLILDKESYDYAKRMTSFIEKSENMKKYKVSDNDKITSDKNCNLFNSLCEKLTSYPFNIMLGKIGNKVLKGRDKFVELDINEQLSVLSSIIFLLKTGRSVGCNLKSIGESGQAGIISINSTLTKIKDFKSIRIIDQSPTGLFEKKSDNLMDL